MEKTQRKKASKKELILANAAVMFRDKGFSATSMRDLAETIGIEAASLYNHIQSKSEILQEIVFRTATECNLYLSEIDNADRSAMEKIEAIIRFHVKMMMDHFEEYHVMTHEWIHLSEPWLSNFVNQRRGYVQRLE